MGHKAASQYYDAMKAAERVRDLQDEECKRAKEDIRQKLEKHRLESRLACIQDYSLRSDKLSEERVQALLDIDARHKTDFDLLIVPLEEGEISRAMQADLARREFTKRMGELYERPDDEDASEEVLGIFNRSLPSFDLAHDPTLQSAQTGESPPISPKSMDSGAMQPSVKIQDQEAVVNNADSPLIRADSEAKNTSAGPDSPEIPLAQLRSRSSQIPDHEKTNLPRISEPEFKIVVSNCGRFYVSPQCMKGVPIAKITEDSTYWMQGWETYESLVYKVDKRLEDATERLDNHKLEIRNVSARRVNDVRLRGMRITEADLETRRRDVECDSVKYRSLIAWFNDSSSIHPNQLLAKEYNSGTGLALGGMLGHLRSILKKFATEKIAGGIKLDATTCLRKKLWHAIKNSRGKSFALKEYLKYLDSVRIEKLLEDIKDVKKEENLEEILPVKGEPVETRPEETPPPNIPVKSAARAKSLARPVSTPSTSYSLPDPGSLKRKFSNLELSPSERAARQPRFHLKSASKRTLSRNRAEASPSQSLPAMQANKIGRGISSETSEKESYPTPLTSPSLKQVDDRCLKIPTAPRAMRAAVITPRQEASSNIQKSFGLSAIHTLGFKWMLNNSEAEYRLVLNAATKILEPYKGLVSTVTDRPFLVIDPQKVGRIISSALSDKVVMFVDQGGPTTKICLRFTSNDTTSFVKLLHDLNDNIKRTKDKDILDGIFLDVSK